MARLVLALALSGFAASAAGVDGRHAVCFTGQLRDFASPRVQEAFRANLHRPEYDYFLSTDQRINATDLLLPLTDSFVSDVGRFRPNLDNHEVCNGTGGYMHVFQSPQTDRLVACAALVSRREKKVGGRYGLILRLRADLLTLRPFPHLAHLYARVRQGADVVSWDDQMQLLPRGVVEEWAIGVQLAYTTCATPEQWLEACRASNNHTDLKSIDAAKIREGHLPGGGCIPMALLGAFSNLRSQQCGMVRNKKCLTACTLDVTCRDENVPIKCKRSDVGGTRHCGGARVHKVNTKVPRSSVRLNRPSTGS